MWWFAVPAFASALCPGPFDASCLSFAPEAILSVASPADLNDFDTWTVSPWFETVEGEPSAIEGGLRWTNPWLYETVSRSLDLPPGDYVLRGFLQAEPHGWIQLRVVLSGASGLRTRGALAVNRQRSGWKLDGDFTESFLVFRVESGDSVEVEIEGYGVDAAGAAVQTAAKDLVLYEVVPVRVWVRFTAVGAAGPTTLSDIDRYNGTFAAVPTFDVPLAPDTPSAWIPVEVTGGWLATYVLQLADPLGIPIAGPTLRVEATVDPSVPPYFDATRTVEGDRIGLDLPHSDLVYDRWAEDTHFTADVPALDLAAFSASYPGPFATPTRYHVLTDLGPWSWCDDPAAELDAVTFARALGLDGTARTSPVPAAVDLQSAGLDAGMVFHYGIVPPTFLSHYSWFSAPYDPVGALAASREVVAGSTVQALLAPWTSRPHDLVVALFDENEGPAFEGSAYHEAFHADLEARGFAPADFGKESWEEIRALEGYDPAFTLQRPDPLADPDGAKLWYWQVRFWNQAGATVQAAARTALEEDPTVGGDFLVTLNEGQPGTYGYYGYTRGIELETMIRAGAVDAIAGEVFFQDWCTAQLTGPAADVLAAYQRTSGLPWITYVHDTRGVVSQDLLALATRGSSWFLHYVYGPVELHADGWGGRGELSRYAAANVAASSDVLARAESTLADAVRPPAQVGFLVAQTDTVWPEPGTYGNILSTEENGLHLAFTHAHVPVDFVLEEHLADPGALDGFAVFHVGRRHLRDDAFAALAAWVEAGGTLVVGPDLPVYDEYAQLRPERQAWLGVEASGTTLATTDVVVDWGETPIVLSGSGADGTGTVLTALLGGTPLATLANGSVVAAETAVGAGRVRVLGFEAGTAYLWPMWWGCHVYFDRRPSGYDSALRGAITDVLAAASVAPPVTVDDPLVEAHRLVTPTGEAVLLLGYGDLAGPPWTVTWPGVPDGEVHEILSSTSLPVQGGVVTVPPADAALLAWESPSPPSTTPPDDPVPPPEADDGAPSDASPTMGGCGCGTTRSGVQGAAVFALLLTMARRKSTRGVAVVPLR